MYFPGFPGGSVIKNLLCDVGNLFDPLSGEIPRALGPLSPCTTTPEPGPQLRQPTTTETPTRRTQTKLQTKRSLRKESQRTPTRVAPLTPTRESLHTTMKTEHSQI